MSNSPNNTLIHTTIKISTIYPNGDKGAGTGFFFRFTLNHNQFVDTIVTNKHVIEDTEKGILAFAYKAGPGLVEQPKYGSIDFVEIEKFSELWIPHPNPDIDLCAFPLYTYVKSMNKYYYVALHEGNLLTDNFQFSAIEDICMIGYPSGLWDDKNNLPIARKGITATNINIDFKGKKEFLIDSACFPGSSGSPVMIYDKSVSFTEGSLTFHSEQLFAGILYAGPQFNIDGTIEIINVPTKSVPISQTQIPMNLGYVIKSSELLAFKTVFSSMI